MEALVDRIGYLSPSGMLLLRRSYEKADEHRAFHICFFYIGVMNDHDGKAGMLFAQTLLSKGTSVMPELDEN